MENPKIRPASPADIPGIVALQRACFPPPFPEDLLWQPDHIASHLDRFPEGQFVAELNNQIVASATNMRVSDQTWDAHLPWQETTGGLHLPHHDPQGQTLYGIDISVHPDHRGQGVARALYQARFDLVQSLRLTRYGTVCRIPGFIESNLPDPNTYAQEVLNQKRQDPTLTPLLKMGLTYLGLIPDYMDDPESADHGAILERVQ